MKLIKTIGEISLIRSFSDWGSHLRFVEGSGGYQSKQKLTAHVQVQRLVKIAVLISCTCLLQQNFSIFRCLEGTDPHNKTLCVQFSQNLTRL